MVALTVVLQRDNSNDNTSWHVRLLTSDEVRDLTRGDVALLAEMGHGSRRHYAQMLADMTRAS